MFKFISFATTEEFEKWQAENKVGIVNMSPVALNVGVDEANVIPEFGIFIVYGEEG